MALITRTSLITLIYWINLKYNKFIYNLITPNLIKIILKISHSSFRKYNYVILEKIILDKKKKKNLYKNFVQLTTKLFIDYKYVNNVSLATPDSKTQILDNHSSTIYPTCCLFCPHPLEIWNPNIWLAYRPLSS